MSLKILYLEDSQSDADMVRRVLYESDTDYAIQVVENQEAYRTILRDDPPDVILADHTLFQFDSMEALKVFKEFNLSIPFILVTGTVSEEFAVSILKAGADDYVLKDRLTRLPSAIHHALEARSAERKRRQSEERNQYILSLLDRSFDEIYVFDRENFQIVYANKGASINTGYSIAKLQSSVFVDVVPEYDFAGFSSLLKPLLTNHKELVEVETSHQRADGTTYPVESHFQYVQFEGKLAFLVVVRDITERKRAEHEIKQFNERYIALSKATNDAIYDWDISSGSFFWGESIYTLFGHTFKENQHNLKDWINLIHQDDKSLFDLELKNALASRDVLHRKQEYRLRRKDETYASVLERAFIIRNSDGKATRMVGAIQDISAQKAHENVLNELNIALKKKAEELSISNAELEQFAYSASHDLKEPLRMVSSFMQLLEKNYGNQLDEKAKRYIYFAVDAAQRMTTLVSELLDYYRLGKEHVSLESVNLELLVQEAVKMNAAMIEEKKAILKIEPLPVVPGVATPLRMLFNNLIDNALKYQKPGVHPEVKITVVVKNSEWLFSIADNGIGISPEHFEKIFRLFKRLHSGSEYEGTGMGLAFCKKVVEQHGGSIWVESREGNGSTFYFTLPKNPQKNDPGSHSASRRQ